MCDPVTATVLVASTLGGALNTQHALEKQDDAAAAGIRRQGDLREEGARRVNDRISRLDRSNPDTAARERLGQYMTALRRSRGDSEGSLADVPGASSRFQSDVSAARADAGGEAATTAGLMSRMDAPIIQRRREGFDSARLASAIQDLNRRSEAERFLTGLKVNSIRPNPFVAAISSLGQGFAKGRASRVKPPGADGAELFAQGTLVDSPSPFTIDTRGLS